jgi:hypothetical protein
MKLCACDFEFAKPANPDMGIICVAIQPEGEETETYWLWKGEQKRQFLSRMYSMKDTHIFVGYSIQQAEARCIASLGIDPNKLQWRDLMLEWRWLRNGDYRYSYGNCIIGGFPRFTVPPLKRVGKKASQADLDEAQEINDAYLLEVQEDMEDGVTAGLAEAGLSMLDCTYFFGQCTFSEYGQAMETKKRVRDGIIIGSTDEDIEANKTDILDYCAGDVGDLIPLAHKITEEMENVASESHMQMLDGEISYVDFEGKVPGIQDMIGKWAARLAKYGLRGIPLHEGRLKKLIEIVPQLTEEAKWEWNTTYPETPIYRIGYPESILELKQQGLKKSPYIRMDVSKDQDLLESFIEEFCRQSGVRNWPRTRTDKIDTSAKVIEKYAAGENAIKQYQRHMGTMSALKTYAPDKSGNVSAMDYIGDDYVQRVDFGPFGTQTARNAAKAKSFCFLGPHWIRMLVDPPKGKVVVELDFGSQEVFIAGAISGDDNLMKAYLSNDVYMFYAQLTGMYPPNLPIPTEEQRAEEWFKPYKKTRSIAKTLNLSMQFGAGAKSVAAAVRSATKDETIDDEQGSQWVSEYNDAYYDYTSKTRDLRDRYKETGTGIALISGWRMGKDNMSPLSAGNLPVQGLGSCILQRACELCDEAGLYVIATLHDAVTLLADEGDEERVSNLATELMKQAAREILGMDGMKVGAPEYVHNGHLWLHSEKAQRAWDKLGKYFEDI